MKQIIFAVSCIASVVHARSSDELCRSTAQQSGGNWYCSEVQAITYRNVSQAGAYNRTISVDPSTGLCSHERVQYPGTGLLTPFFGEMSMHLRGPINISHFAVYQLPSEVRAAQRRTTVPFYNRQRHRKRSRPLSWPNDGGSQYKDTVMSNTSVGCTTDTTTKRNTASSIWSRVAHYQYSAPSQATGLSFLANLGDPRKSGTFDYAFGSSLSYVTQDGTKVASQSLPFDGSLLTSETEIAIFSDHACDGDCGYTRPDTVTLSGWPGSSKAFFVEVQMDHYPNKGNDQGLISDAPAIWFLNADIPRILQYGSDRNNVPCSCWSSGCGEFDVFEVLEAGEERGKSTLHRQGNLEGGDSNYFRRPVGKKSKLAIIWHFPHITITRLDDDFDFGTSFTDEEIQEMVQYDPRNWQHSLFAIGD